MLRPCDLLSEKTIDSADLERFFSLLGFRRPERAHRSVRDILDSGIDPKSLATNLEPLLQTFAGAVDPDLCLANFGRFLEAVEDPSGLLDEIAAVDGMIERIARVLGSSNFLARVLIRHPEYWKSLDVKPATASASRGGYLEAARTAIARSNSGRDRLDALHDFQQKELLRIGHSDLAHKDSMAEVTRQLSSMADAIVQVVLDEARRDLEDRIEANLRFAVIGVGKLGGEELNFSSDIDVIYIYGDDAHFDDATRLARRLHRDLTEGTASGAFYRVDLRLRPEGRRGPLASSIQSLRTYYGTWGETFERLMLAKARCIAGDEQIGADFLELVQPFVYRKYLDLAASDEVRDIKRRIDLQVDASGELDLNVKLGWGGIREIEFFVQALQVIYGGQMMEIRERSTLRALERLAAASLVETEVAERLSEAYVFLRNVEHKLQIVDQRQTHTLPEDDEEMERCARRMGMSLDLFRSRLESHRSEVHAVFQDLFAAAGESDEGLGSRVYEFVNCTLGTEDAEAWLGSLGFEDARQARTVLESLRDAPAFGHSPTRVKNLLANVLTPLLEAVGELPRTGNVLTGFERLTTALGGRESFFRSLLERPESISRLAHLFALSDWLSDTLIQHPGTAEFLIDEERLSRPIRPPFETDSRRMLEFYVGIQYLFRVIDRRQACRLLNRFAEREIQKHLGAETPIALFALGKFGERELNYRSDLDVMAFYRGDYADACRHIEKLVETMGTEFSIDLRLRPEGRKGSLVWDLDSTRRYLENRAQVWERMAWAKARFVAGSANIAAEFEPMIEDFVYGTAFGAAEVDEMKHIRMRMEKELAKEGSGAFNLKLGRGGLVDLEFMAEIIQIRGKIRVPNTAVVLRRARAPQEWTDAYHFLREVESMLHLRTSLSNSRVEAKHIPALEKMLGLSDFPATYTEVTSRVREAFDSYAV